MMTSPVSTYATVNAMVKCIAAKLNVVFHDSVHLILFDELIIDNRSQLFKQAKPISVIGIGELKKAQYAP